MKLKTVLITVLILNSILLIGSTFVLFISHDGGAISFVGISDGPVSLWLPGNLFIQVSLLFSIVIEILIVYSLARKSDQGV
jgi:hypothetical protein